MQPRERAASAPSLLLLLPPARSYAAALLCGFCGGLEFACLVVFFFFLHCNVFKGTRGAQST